MGESALTKPPRAYVDYLQTADGRRAEDWQLRLMAGIRWGVEPTAETYRALRAGMRLAIRRDDRSVV